MKKVMLLVIILTALGFSCKAQKGYEKSIETGYSIGVGDVKNNTFSLAMINGYRFSPTFYAGLGVGIGFTDGITGLNISTLDIRKEYRTEAYLIPVYLHAKINLTHSNTSPFFSINTGYTFDLNSYLKDAPGFMIQPSFGVDFKINNKMSIYALTGLNFQHCRYSYTYHVSNIADWDIDTKSEMIKAIDLKIGFRF